MPVTGGMSENPDGTKNYSMTAVKEDDGKTVTASAFVAGYRDKPDPMKLNAPQYSAAGGAIDVSNPYGHSLGLNATYTPPVGTQVTTSTNLNLVHNETHRMDVNAFATAHIPKTGPNFMTQGAGASYMFKEKAGLNASVSQTPYFKQTDYGLGGSLNVHRTPNSSFDVNIGANKTVTPFHNSSWNKSIGFGYKRTF